MPRRSVPRSTPLPRDLRGGLSAKQISAFLKSQAKRGPRAKQTREEQLAVVLLDATAKQQP